MDDGTLADVVAHLRALGRDDETTEAKASVRRLSADVWETVSAFANTRGGTLLLGIDEGRGFRPAEGFSPDRVLDQFIEGVGDGGKDGAKVSNPPRYSVSTPAVDGATVLVVDIMENSLDAKPCYITQRGIQPGSFKRVGDKDLRLSTVEIFEMQRVLQPSDADRIAVPDTEIEDLDPDLLERYLSRRSGSRALKGVGDDRRAALRRLNIVDRSGAVRMTGLLTMGLYPQQHFPQLHIDVAVHPGASKSTADSVTRFLDRRICEGSLAEMVEEAVQAIVRNLRTYSTISGTRRIDELEIPREVLREAISNAVIHREYSAPFLGEGIAVDVFTDRVEVRSPGGLWGGRTKENIADGVSQCRNQALIHVLRDLPLDEAPGAIVEGQGSGVPFMVNEMRAHTLPDPLFAITPASVTVVLGRHGVEVPGNREWLRDLAGRDVNHRESQVLLQARELPLLTVESVHDALQLDSDEVRSILHSFTDEGVLESTSEGWCLAGRALDQAAHGSGDAARPGPAVVSKALTPAEASVVDAMSASEPLSIRDIAERTGSSVVALRPILRRLVAAEVVIPTAPPTSRRRRYVLHS